MRHKTTNQITVWLSYIAIAVVLIYLLSVVGGIKRPTTPPTYTNPVGGGLGYANIIYGNNTSIDYYITTTNSRINFLNALNTASSGDIIYINGNVNIDLTPDFNINIPAGITIASDRGNGSSQGALLYDTYSVYHGCGAGYPGEKFLFKPNKGVRITGLRVSGAAIKKYSCPQEYSYSWGFAPVHPDMEFDNNELYNFSVAAIGLYNMTELSDTFTYIHNNYIHNNERGTGFGYGIEVGALAPHSGSNALIESNLFDWNRHSIAGYGDNTRYIARNNIQLGNGRSHGFDMHGNGTDGGGGQAGTRIEIYNNTFYYITDENSWYVAVAIRGIPSDGAYIHDNYLYGYNMYDAFYQPADFLGNFYAYNNTFK